MQPIGLFLAVLLVGDMFVCRQNVDSAKEKDETL